MCAEKKKKGKKRERERENHLPSFKQLWFNCLSSEHPAQQLSPLLRALSTPPLLPARRILSLQMVIVCFAVTDLWSNLGGGGGTKIPNLSFFRFSGSNCSVYSSCVFTKGVATCAGLQWDGLGCTSEHPGVAKGSGHAERNLEIPSSYGDEAGADLKGRLRLAFSLSSSAGRNCSPCPSLCSSPGLAMSPLVLVVLGLLPARRMLLIRLFGTGKGKLTQVVVCRLLPSNQSICFMTKDRCKALYQSSYWCLFIDPYFDLTLR